MTAELLLRHAGSGRDAERREEVRTSDGQECPSHAWKRGIAGRGAEDQIDQFEKRKRHLPHWEDPGATYFIRFGVRHPAPMDLTRPDIAKLIVGALHHFDGERYLLFDYTVMPDHVHMILKPIVRGGKTERLWRITRSLKGWLAYRINHVVGRSGPFWQDESYDHIIRDQADYLEKAGYIYENPCRQGLVKDPAAWPWWGKGSGPGMERSTRHSSRGTGILARHWLPVTKPGRLTCYAAAEFGEGINSTHAETRRWHVAVVPR